MILAVKSTFTFLEKKQVMWHICFNTPTASGLDASYKYSYYYDLFLVLVILHAGVSDPLKILAF